MKILGIDTTTKFLCLGIYDGAKMYEYNLEVGPKLSALLIPVIQRTLLAAGLKVSEIDYFACGLGPGSFTGIRVGLAAIKGLSWAQKKPVVGIPTLDTLARNARGCAAGRVVPVIDAKRNLIYASVYKEKNGALQRVRPYMLLCEKELRKNIKDNSLLLGDALALYREGILTHKKGVAALDKDYWYPKAHNLIALAKEKIRRGQASSALDIKPIYLYPKECQIKKR